MRTKIIFIPFLLLLCVSKLKAQDTIRILHYTETTGYDHGTRTASAALFQRICDSLDATTSFVWMLNSSDSSEVFDNVASLNTFQVIVWANTSGFAGNLSSATKTVQDLAAAVDTLPVSAGIYQEFTAQGNENLTTARNKTYFITNKFTGVTNGITKSLIIITPPTSGGVVGDTVDVYMSVDNNATKNANIEVSPNVTDTNLHTPLGTLVVYPSRYVPAGQPSGPTLRTAAHIKLALTEVTPGNLRWQVVSELIMS